MTITIAEAQAASVRDLAQCILDNADGSPMSASFMRTAAIELAKRILPNGEAAQLPEKFVNWHWQASQGEAEPRASEKRGMEIAMKASLERAQEAEVIRLKLKEHLTYLDKNRKVIRPGHYLSFGTFSGGFVVEIDGVLYMRDDIGIYASPEERLLSLDQHDTMLMEIRSDSDN